MNVKPKESLTGAMISNREFRIQGVLSESLHPGNFRLLCQDAGRGFVGFVTLRAGRFENLEGKTQ